MKRIILFIISMVIMCNVVYAYTYIDGKEKHTIYNSSGDEITSTTIGGNIMLDVSADLSNSGDEAIGAVQITDGTDTLLVDTTGSGHITVFSDNGNQIKIDDDGAVFTVDEKTNCNHEGNMFEVAKLAIDIANDLSASLYLSVSDGYEVHITFEGATEGKAYSYMYESPTVSGGTAVTPLNKNRISSNTSNLTCLFNPTISAYGTELWAGYLPGETGPKTAGGEDAASHEWVLAPNTAYLAVLWNKGGAPKDASLVANWCEKEV